MTKAESKKAYDQAEARVKYIYPEVPEYNLGSLIKDRLIEDWGELTATEILKNNREV